MFPNKPTTPTVYTMAEEAEQRAQDVAGLLVDGVPATKLLERNEVPRVRHELVVPLKAKPPADWALQA